MTSAELLMAPPIFLDEGSALRPVGAAIPDGAISHRHIQPAYEYDWDFFTIVMFQISIPVGGILDGTTFSVTPSLEFAQESVKGVGPTLSQWRERRWDTVTDFSTYTVEGSFFGTINAPGTYRRTVRYFPRSMRINLSTLAIGGTLGADPRLLVSLEGFPK